MDRYEPCGAPTRNGRPCRFPYLECPIGTHRRWRVAQSLPVPPELPPRRQGPPGGGGSRPAASSVEPAPAGEPDTLPRPDPLPAQRDVRAFAWWVFEQVASGALDPRRGTALAGVLRALHSLGPEPASEEERLAEIALRGLLMHGQPPRTDEDWERAEATFTDEAIEEFRRWLE